MFDVRIIICYILKNPVKKNNINIHKMKIKLQSKVNIL